jgi:hypothetical protein
MGDSIESLKRFEGELRSLRTLIKAEQVKQINKVSIRNKTESIASEWFSSIVPQLQAAALRPELIESYSTHFTSLLNICGPGNSKSRYLEEIETALKCFKKDFILGLQTRSATPASQLQVLLGSIQDSTYAEYLQEAIECSRHELYRGAAVLGWAAAIDQIHRSLELRGFEEFNKKSAWMTAQTKGKFKKFSQSLNVTSISELREVFDNIILWVLEGMELIDGNQHTRLHSCFELRCQCSHPGEAPVTEYNLLSFFSDLNEIVFKNATFAL